MANRGEIREELARRRYYDGMVGIGSGIPKWEDRTEVERQYFRAKIDRDFQYLHSQGGMLKVKCPNCEWSQFEDEVVTLGMTPCYRCNNTGYVYEPLIEEEK